MKSIIKSDYFIIYKLFIVLILFGPIFGTWLDKSPLIPSCNDFLKPRLTVNQNHCGGKVWFCVVLLNGVLPLLLNEGRQRWNLLECDHWVLAGSPWPKTVRFRDLVGVGIAPLSKKLTVKYLFSSKQSI